MDKYKKTESFGARSTTPPQTKRVGCCEKTRPVGSFADSFPGPFTVFFFKYMVGMPRNCCFLRGAEPYMIMLTLLIIMLVLLIIMLIMLNVKLIISIVRTMYLRIQCIS